ncbi:MAG: hypothetical protein RQ745_11210 [Longimicrobiales bacterium]|nr:hypothetical protein [Longimicrobiales bacterium]
MTRSLAAAYAWRRPYWWTVGPGRWTAAILALTPFTLVLPWSELPVLRDAEAAAGFVVWASAIVLALRMSGPDGVRDEGLIWVYQKGVTPGETAFANLLLDTAFALVFVVWWSLIGTLLAGSGTGVSILFAGLVVRGVSAFLVTYCVLFALSAFGVERPNDLAVALLLVSLLVPTLILVPGAEGLAWLRWAVPPFRAPIALSTSLVSGNMVGTSEAALHITLYVGLLVGAAGGRLARWRPNS